MRHHGNFTGVVDDHLVQLRCEGRQHVCICGDCNDTAHGVTREDGS